jgi:hypothetical protein
LRRYGIGLTLLLAVLVRVIYTITLGIPGLQPIGLIIELLWVLLFLYTITINPIFNFMIKRGLIK